MFQEDMYQKLKKDWVYKMSIKKQLLIRGLIGAAVGFFICYFITIITSVIIGNGEFYPVVPQAIELFGTELNAVIAQTIISMIYGAILSGTSVIWTIDRWSLIKQTITHLLIYSTATIPVAYFLYWMPHNVISILIYYSDFYYNIFLYMAYIIYQNKNYNKKNKHQAISKQRQPD